MKFCISLPHGTEVQALTQEWEKGVGGAEIARAVRLADELGFQSVMLGEHFVIPAGHVGLSGDHYLQATTALGFVAGCTQRIKLATSVTILPLQHPIVHAKMWATLDWLSGGRAIMSVGVGWLEEEYDLLGVPFRQRGALCDEYLAAIHELWTSDSPTFDGKYVKFKDVGQRPKPVQKPRIPIWFGGEADPVLKRVAKWGDGWSPFTTPPEKFPERLDFIRSQPDYHGRPIALQFALSRLGLGDGHVKLNNPKSVGSQDAQYVLDQIGWLAGLGVTEVRLAVPPFTAFEAYLDWLRWTAEEIFPKAP